MSHWIFKLDLSIIENLNFEIVSVDNSAFNGSERDQVIFLLKDNDGWKFKYQAKIKSFKIEMVNLKEKIDTHEDIKKIQYKNTIEFEDIDEIAEPNLLIDFSYSLKRIKRFDNPIFHFRKKSRITKFEYSNITQGKLFLYRTALGTIINSLPLLHKINFIKKFIEDYPSEYLKNNTYTIAFKVLKEYINNYIIIPSDYLKETFNIYQDLELKNSSELLIGDEEVEYDVINQVKKIQDFYNNPSLNQTDIFEEIETNSQSLRDSYNKYFSNVPWPFLGVENEKTITTN